MCTVLEMEDCLSRFVRTAADLEKVEKFAVRSSGASMNPEILFR